MITPRSIPSKMTTALTLIAKSGGWYERESKLYKKSKRTIGGETMTAASNLCRREAPLQANAPSMFSHQLAVESSASK